MTGFKTIPLGPLDHIASSNIPQSVIYLSLKEDTSPQSAFDCLREGLKHTLSQTPWLAGRVHYQSESTPGWRPGQLEIRYPSDTISSKIFRFNQLETCLSFSDLHETGFPLDSFDDEALLWTSPFDPDFDQGAHVLAAQANFVSGGCILVLSVAAPASDGTAMLAVTKIWADHCSNALSQVDSNVPRLRSTTDRSVLDTFLEDKRTLRFDHLSIDDASEISRLVGFDDAPNDPPSGFDSSGMEPKVFYMPQSAYTSLRKQCTQEFGAAEISGNDLICALIFRSLVRASTSSGIPSSTSTELQVASLSLPFDGRPKLLQSMESLYLGNVNYENRVTVPLETLIAPGTSVPWVANAIYAHAEESAHIDMLLAAYYLARSATKYDNQQGLRAARMHPPTSVGVMAPMTLPFNDTCFGKHVFANNGNPEAFRPLMGSCNRGYRTCFVVPRKKAGGIEFVMTLSEEELDFLASDEEFSQYAFSLS
ncbi:unnamed protein product [Penicillium bialowiezense]